MLVGLLLLPTIVSAVMLKKGPIPDELPSGYSDTLASGTVMGTSHLPKPYAKSPLDTNPLPAVPQAAPNGDQPVEVLWPYEVKGPTLVAKPASATAPDIPTTVGERLADDSRRLGQSAQHLLSAQRKLNAVEEDALRKSFDLQSLRHLDDKDRAEWQEHLQLEAEVERLRGVLANLLDDLADKVHKPCPSCSTPAPASYNVAGGKRLAGTSPPVTPPPARGVPGAGVHVTNNQVTNVGCCDDDGGEAEEDEDEDNNGQRPYTEFGPDAGESTVPPPTPVQAGSTTAGWDGSLGMNGQAPAPQAATAPPQSSDYTPTDAELTEHMKDVLEGLASENATAAEILDACREASGRPCPPPSVVPQNPTTVAQLTHNQAAAPAPAPMPVSVAGPSGAPGEPSVMLPEPCGPDWTAQDGQEPCPTIEPGKSRPQTLEEMLVAHYRYARTCRRRATELQEVVRELKSQHDALCENAINVTRTELEEQKFLAQANKALEPRLEKALANLRTIRFQQSVVARQTALLEQYGEQVKQKLNEELETAQGKVDFARGNLSSVLQHRNATQYTSQHVQGQLNRYNEMLRSGKLALAKNNNSRIKADMQHISQEIRDSQIVLVKARADANSSSLREAGWKNITAENLKYAQNITRAALDNIVLIKASDDELERQAQADLLEAEAGSTVKCTDIWDREHPDIKQQVEQCPALETELQNVQAAVTALTSATGGNIR
mmetsp:Transcript_47987/g.88320  ORF Transcript_47987/g.88320 Transcript_47987/m.88320 type:complete len:720 (+) Transcript_47987:113-2272(+)